MRRPRNGSIVPPPFAPNGDRRLYQLPYLQMVFRLRPEIIRLRISIGVRIQQSAQLQITGDRLEHMLPGPYGCRVANVNGLSGLQGPYDIRNDGVAAPIPAADHIPRPHAR